MRKTESASKHLCRFYYCKPVSTSSFHLNYVQGIKFSIRNFVSPLATSLQAHVISTFQRIDVTREEYLLLKLIALFEVLDMRFLPNDRFIMEEALTKYRSALVFHIKHSHPELHHEAVVERVSELLGVLTYLESVTEFDNVHMADIIRRNKGNMRGRLTAEVHVQKTQHQ
ncbi:hypothetical protein ANCCAN_09231 [Ancylostoma caninum]|uniref:NR LBD domain-containing protein n=1 Tax=Ancylostoma caninum TaxID=29170 RepID=A0A368GK80_ANCCA|nr:hypothetical protein ANCCAN_09231 [Ancylostoma caninum]